MTYRLSLGEYGIRLVEQQYRLDLRAAAQPLIAGEDILDYLLALPVPHTFGCTDIYMHHVPAALPRPLQHRLGLAGTRSTIKQDRDAFGQPFLLQPGYQ